MKVSDEFMPFTFLINIWLDAWILAMMILDDEDHREQENDSVTESANDKPQRKMTCKIN